MKRIEVAKAPTSMPKGTTPLSYLSEFCYRFPRYSLAEARRLPYKHVKTLMAAADRLEAKKMYYLTLITTTPHQKNANDQLNELIEHFRNIMDGQ